MAEKSKRPLADDDNLLDVKQMVMDKIDDIRARLDDKYNEFQNRISEIKEAIEKKKQARKKRIQKSVNLNTEADNMSDIIDDLKIN